MKQIHPLRLLLKAAGLFLLANVLFALYSPPVGRISVYNLLVPGRTRFPFGAGVVDSNISVDNLDAMFASHVISAPKRADEFRVVILGDSSIWGTLLYADQTLAAQLNAMQFACPGKTLRFYNLGYPHPSVLQDLLILQRALEYQPDMVIWAVSPNSLRPKFVNPFLDENIGQVANLVNTYQLRHPGESLKPPHETFFERTLVGQRNLLSRMLLLQSLALPWVATGLDIEPIGEYQRPANDLSSSLAFGSLPHRINIRGLLLLDHLKAGVQMSAGVPILFVNQPIFVATGKNSDKRYNTMYPRWAYNQYRQIMRRQAKSNHWAYLDLWKIAPAKDFTDYELHLSPDGEQRMAKGMQAALQEIACP